MIDLNPESVIKSPYFAGLVGSVISLRWVPGGTVLEKLIIIAIGVGAASFLGPAAGEYFGLHSQAMQSAISFMIGLFGLNLMAAVALWIKTVDLSTIFRR
jgi:hypothetical protein